MKNKGFWKIGFIIILLILILLVGFVAFLFGKGELNFDSILKNEQQVLVEEKNIVTPTPNLISEIQAIKEAVYKKTGLTSGNADVTVDKYTSTHAKGGVKEKEAVGGAYFIAAKLNDKWICVYDGQSQPTCEQIEPYDFPIELVPECLDSSNQVVER